MTMPNIWSSVAILTFAMTLVAAESSPHRDLQQTEYRVVFESFLLPFTSTQGTACSSDMAQTMRAGFEDCLRIYSRQRCNIEASYIGLGGASCASDSAVFINGGVFSFNGLDALPVIISNCVREAAYSKTCMQTLQAVLPELGSIGYGVESPMPALMESPPPSDVPSPLPSDSSVSIPSMSPSQQRTSSLEPTLSASAAPTDLASDNASDVPSLLPVESPASEPSAPSTTTRVPTSTSGIVNEALPKSQKSRSVPVTLSTVGIALAAVLLLLAFVVRRRGRSDRSARKAMFEPMDDDDESNASGFIGIAPMQATNKNGDLEQAVEISLKRDKYRYKESALNRTLSTEASSSPNKSAEDVVLPDVQKKFRNIAERQNSLPRPDVTPRRTRSRNDTTPFDEEIPSNPTVTPSPVVVNKEICGSSWWKQMNSSGKKVRNPTLCPYSPIVDDGLCCPRSVPGIILDKSTVRDDVSDFELDGAWDPDDTSVPSNDGMNDHFHTSQQQRSVASNEVLPPMVTPPNAKHKSHFSGMLPPLRKKNDANSRLVLGASSRQQSGFELDQIIAGSEKEV